MANHCWNWISFTGETEKMELLEKKLNTYKQTKYFTEWGDYVLNIGEIGDTPEIFSNRHKNDPYYVYGTKWFDFDVDDKNIDEKSGQCNFRISGESAWSPPITFIERICETYNLTAEMEYEEGGMDFAGIIKIDGIETISHDEMTAHEYRYISDVGNWIENIGYNYEGEDNYDDILEELKENHSYAKEKDLKEVVIFLKEVNELYNKRNQK